MRLLNESFETRKKCCGLTLEKTTTQNNCHCSEFFVSKDFCGIFYCCGVRN